MKARSLHSVVRAVDGTLRSSAAGVIEVRGVVIDSRRAGPGDLFVALAGQRRDGHDFVGGALQAGAAALIRRRALPESTGPVVEVDDPARALLDLAADERAATSATVVGITGSTGKTCTKDLMAAVLDGKFRTVASEASFNNEVGLPLTLLRGAADTEVIVCEMGSRGPGHIKLLCGVARPDVGVVTNVGVAHMELFGSPRALHDAKAELLESLPAAGIAVLNADDEVVRGYAGRTDARAVLFGTGAGAEVRGENVRLDRATGAATFRLSSPDGSAQTTLSVPGEHMVPNALAAAAVGWSLGVPVGECAAALAGASVSAGRMAVFETARGVRVIDDSYNANPASMAAALKAARWMAGEARCIAVLGYMAELGPIEDQEHERVGELLARFGFHELVVVGLQAARIAVGAEREGVEPERILRAAGVDEALEIVRSIARPSDVVLVKASRVVGLDRVAQALRAERSADSHVGPHAPRGHR